MFDRRPINRQGTIVSLPTQPHSHSLPPSLTHILPHSYSLTHTHTLSLTHTLTYSLPPSLPSSLPHSLTHSLTPLYYECGMYVYYHL